MVVNGQAETSKRVLMLGRESGRVDKEDQVSVGRLWVRKSRVSRSESR